jgi:peptidoglycan/xylan/chitin deacetylase (PgdA/CDA1 family)
LKSIHKWLLLAFTAAVTVSAAIFMVFTPASPNLVSKDSPLRESARTAPEFTRDPVQAVDRETLLAELSDWDMEAGEWGERVTGVKNRHDTEEKVIALTFDACGGPLGNGIDEELISFLQENKIPATLFVNFRWIDEHEERFIDLADDPLFTIENHGTAHLPLSVQGNSAWGINGTSSPEEAVDEILVNQEHIAALTGNTPAFFRSGTAHYDEKAVEIVQMAGLEAVNFDILGDAGATYSAGQVEAALLESRPGSIALLHMNQPSSGTAEGVKRAVPALREAGFTFVHVGDYPLTE